MVKEESENPMRAIKMWKLVLNDRVDRSVRAEKVSQQAEKNEDSANQKNLRSQEEGRKYLGR